MKWCSPMDYPIIDKILINAINFLIQHKKTNDVIFLYKFISNKEEVINSMSSFLLMIKVLFLFFNI